MIRTAFEMLDLSSWLYRAPPVRGGALSAERLVATPAPAAWPGVGTLAATCSSAADWLLPPLWDWLLVVPRVTRPVAFALWWRAAVGPSFRGAGAPPPLRLDWRPPAARCLRWCPFFPQPTMPNRESGSERTTLRGYADLRRALLPTLDELSARGVRYRPTAG